jgi:Na+-transporting NADH:ubiquinone oxidoreductase subunit NqrB
MGEPGPSGRDAGAVQAPEHPSPEVPSPVKVAAPPRTVRMGGRRYPFVLPSIRDPRLHLAAVIISIHILGQTVLGFRVSVVQILVAILTCAMIEVTWTFVSSRSFVWPASAMLTGSGVALIFRVIGTENGDYWSWHGWYLFAIVAACSLLTKYVIQYRGSHVFNPSNVGLVAAFLILGSTRVEPLDFWWAPFGFWMALAYAIIIVGGVLITRAPAPA